MKNKKTTGEVDNPMKKRVHVSECTDTDVLAEDITNSYNAFILPRGTIINQYIVQKLTELGIEHVFVASRNVNGKPSYIDYHVFEKRYENSIKEMKQLVLEVIRGKRIDYNVISKIARTVTSAFEEPEHIIKCLSKVQDIDDYTYYHCINVSFYAMLIGGWLNLAREDIKTLIHAALLHDMGKTRIPNELLNKRDKLSAQEFEEIKRHAIYGYELVRDNIEISEEIKDVILMHHEREDKSGYPLCTDGSNLSIYTKIVAVADVYDAMTSDRAYKKALTPFDAFEEFLTVCRGCLDIHIVNTFIYNISRCYAGSRVLLSTGQAGSIAYIPPHCIWKPIVDIGSDFLDLSREKDVSIASMA